MEEQREESEPLGDSRVPLEETAKTQTLVDVPPCIEDANALEVSGSGVDVVSVKDDVEKTDEPETENCQMECEEGDADVKPVNGAGEEETVGNKVTDEEANCEVEDNPGTVLEVSPAAETRVEEDTTHKEENGEAMDIDYTEEGTLEKVVLDDAGASVVPTQDVPIAVADSNPSNVVDERKDNGDMASDLTDSVKPNNSSVEDAAVPGNIQQDLKTETGNVSLKEDKKASVTAEEVATEEDCNEALKSVGATANAESCNNTEGVENASNEAHVATECPEEASDENQDEKDQQDTRREEGDTTHEAPNIDQNQLEDTVMEENPDNSDYAEVGTDSDTKTNGVKRKADVLSEEDSLGEGSRKTVSLAKVSFAQRPSFKIGACIARAASQMAGSPSVLKGSNLGDETLSVESFVSQLHSAATDPVKESVVSEIATGFFLDFRNSSASQQFIPEKASSKRGRPSKSNAGGGTEAFEFEEMGDTYWTDRVIHNGGEEQTPATEKENYQVMPVELKPAQVKRTRRPYRRRQSQISYPLPSASDKPADFDENAPAELIMYFSETDTIPSEKSLSKMFRHFGPIRDSQTEVDEEKNRARVVFRKGADAEIAYKRAGKFNIFGTKTVNYELSFTITETFKVKPYVVSLGEVEAAVSLSS
ncbi:hypothetical protein N665_0011s0120 [Sinapis alba]|nr:hypothetical protein N665_0011s0120 [Sinapis alba]